MPKIADLDHAAALRVLFAGLPFTGAAIIPPLGWPAWTKPEPAKPIDDEIERLLNPTRRNAVALDRARWGDSCPYYGMRQLIAVAVVGASREAAERQRNAERRRHLGTLSQRAAILRDEMAALLGAVPRMPSRPGAGMREDPTARNAALAARSAELSAMAGALPALDALAASLAEERDALPENKGDVFGRAFARQLAQHFGSLTGRPPSNQPGGPFRRFVAAAWASLGQERAPGSWESVVAGALQDLAAQPAWDRPGTREMDPPGTGFVTVDEMRARREAARQREDEDLRALGIDPDALRPGRIGGKKPTLN